MKLSNQALKKAKEKTVKNRTLIISIVLVCVTITLALAVATYAIWERQSEDFSEVQIPTGDVNPSEKYIIYQGLDEDGNFTDDDESIKAYAVVGYSGIVSELIIPSTYNGKDVTRISCSQTELDSNLTGNQIITSMVIPETVVLIDQGVCANMLRLKSVTINGTAEITIEALAFAGCVELNTFSINRTINGNPNSYLYNTNVSIGG